jgi:threonine/homoserine/homoserine lactone efflux protein
MTLSLFLSMAAFALTASISPGPVNIVALSSGVRFGFRASMYHVTGATLGFALLLLLIGLGLHELLTLWPSFTTVVQWAGVAFLLYMAYRLATDDGQLGTDKEARPPTVFHGAAMQWLNPKAWLASVAGMGAYAASGETELVWQFTLLYFLICYVSIGCWAYAGAFLSRYLQDEKRMRRFNQVMAVLLAASALYLLLD